MLNLESLYNRLNSKKVKPNLQKSQQNQKQYAENLTDEANIVLL